MLFRSEYRILQEETARLTDAMADAQAQANILAHDQRGFQGVISGLSGIAGGFSAATGAISLFAGENENLQKLMLKVQSLMAITIGLQQVQQTLNKDSAFMLVTMAKAKTVVAAATTRLNAAFIRMGLSATSARIAVQSLYATLTLGLSAAIGALIYLYNRHNKKQDELKKSIEESSDAYQKHQTKITDMAKEYGKQIAEIDTLRAALKNEAVSYNQKMAILKKLKELIPDYNATLSKEGDIIWENKTAIDAYLVSLDKSLRYKAALQELSDIYADIYKQERGEFVSAYPKGMDRNSFDKYIYEQNNLKQTDAQPAGWLDYVEQQWQDYYNAGEGKLEELKDKAAEVMKFISDNSLRDITKRLDNSKVKNDPFQEMLDSRKSAYAEYSKWINSSDEQIREAAKTQFADLIKDGESYEQYLRKLKEEVLNMPQSKEQNKQVQLITTELVSIEKANYMDNFTKALNEQVESADNVIDKLNVIIEKRKELDNIESPLQPELTAAVDLQEEKIAKQAQLEVERTRRELSDYYQDRINGEIQFQEKRKELEDKINRETNADRKKVYENELQTLQNRQDLSDAIDYDQLLETYKSYEQRCADISAEYDQKIALAKQNNNAEMIKKL